MDRTLRFWQLPISGVYAVHAGLGRRKVVERMVLLWL